MIITLNVAVSWGLLLLIWLVQIIIYPSFRNVKKTVFVQYHRWYVVRIGSFVFPLMMAEVVLIYYFASIYHLNVYVLLGVLMIVVVWLSTIFIQVPIHRKISKKKNIVLIEKLIKTNWLRTIAWSAKAVLVTFLFKTPLS
jgi:hypothetical protein